MKPSKYLAFRKFREILGCLYTLFQFFLNACLRVFRINPNTSFQINSEEIGQSFSRVAVFAAYINSAADEFEAKRVLIILSNDFDLLLLVNTGTRDFKVNLAKVFSVRRENFGRDIISYKSALNSLNLENTSELFLFNDSVFWTGESILKFLNEARNSDYCVTSLTSSDQHSFHLQSYALHFKGSVGDLSKAFSKIKVSNFKRILVEAGEKKLSRFWISKQIQIGSIYSQKSLTYWLPIYKSLYGEDYAHLNNLLLQRVPVNPSIHLWAPLYGQSGVIKKALISKNPARLKYTPTSLNEVQFRIKLEGNLNE